MLVNNFLLPLLITIIIEVLVALLLNYREGRLLLLIIVVNLMTNPLMNFISILIYQLGLSAFFYEIIILLEVLLIPLEWQLLSYAFPDKKKELFKLSAMMNLCSFTLGLVLL